MFLPLLFSDSFSDAPSCLVVSVGAASSRSTTMASLPPTLAVRPWRRPDDSLFPSPPVISRGEEMRGEAMAAARSAPGQDLLVLVRRGMPWSCSSRTGPTLPFLSLHCMQLILGLYVLYWSNLHSNFFLCYLMSLMFLKYVFSIIVQIHVWPQQ